MHGSISKIPSAISVRQRCADGFISGVKRLKDADWTAVLIWMDMVNHRITSYPAAPLDQNTEVLFVAPRYTDCDITGQNVSQKH
jgi:hypothetical protein